MTRWARTLILRIQGVKALQYVFGMPLVLRKDDGLGDAVACRLSCPWSSDLQDRVHGLLVEYNLFSLFEGMNTGKASSSASHSAPYPPQRSS
ncbi:MAG: hypothetical protein ACLVJ6_07890 [Merdibacter sp.]